MVSVLKATPPSPLIPRLFHLDENGMRENEPTHQVPTVASIYTNCSTRHLVAERGKANGGGYADTIPIIRLFSDDGLYRVQASTNVGLNGAFNRIGDQGDRNEREI